MGNRFKVGDVVKVKAHRLDQQCVPSRYWNHKMFVSSISSNNNNILNIIVRESPYSLQAYARECRLAEKTKLQKLRDQYFKSKGDN